MQSSLLNNSRITLQENIDHHMGIRPYSLHHTIVEVDDDIALYLHWHYEFELFYLEQGNLTFYIEDQIYNLHQDEAIFVPSGLLHMAKRVDKTPCSFYAIVFSPDFLMMRYSQTNYEHYIKPFLQHNLGYVCLLTSNQTWSKVVLHYISSILAHYSEPISDWDLHFLGTLLLLWDQLYRHHLSTCSCLTISASSEAQFAPVIEWLHLHYADDIKLADLARIAHLSEGQFCRSFKNYTGMTPFSYLNRYRVLQSAKFLQETDNKIADIATQSGFNNISHYNREFQKYLRAKPSAYRNHIK